MTHFLPTLEEIADFLGSLGLIEEDLERKDEDEEEGKSK